MLLKKCMPIWLKAIAYTLKSDSILFSFLQLIQFHFCLRQVFSFPVLIAGTSTFSESLFSIITIIIVLFFMSSCRRIVCLQFSVSFLIEALKCARVKISGKNNKLFQQKVLTLFATTIPKQASKRNTIRNS